MMNLYKKKPNLLFNSIRKLLKNSLKIGLFISFSVGANTAVKPLMLSAYIMKNDNADGIRIEAEQYTFNGLYLWSVNRFQAVHIPFKVFSDKNYKLESQQFYYRCQSESSKDWVDRSDVIHINFDNSPSLLGVKKTEKKGRLLLPDIHYSAPAEGELNVSNNPYPTNTGWDAWYRNHQFDIVHGEFLQKNESQTCQGMIGIMATSLL